MAAIHCPDCNNLVSELAESCPHCARPTPRLSVRELEELAKAEQAKKSQEEWGNSCGGMILLWFGNAILAGMAKGSAGFIGALVVGPLIWLV